MMKDTWNEEPEKRPLFTDIVNFLHEQNIVDTPMDDADHATVDGEKDSGYLVIFQLHSVNDT